MNYIEYNQTDQAAQKRTQALLERSRAGYWKQKRVFDIILSSVILVLLLPYLLLVALIIFLDDPHGSPIFCQTRIGRHGKPFQLYKFRIMVVNAEELREELIARNEMDGPVFKIKDDPSDHPHWKISTCYQY